MVTTDKREWAEKIKVMTLHGLSKDAWRRYSDSGYKQYDVVYPGYKYNMTDIQASIGIHQLKKIEKWQERRKNIWEYYTKELTGLPLTTPSHCEKDYIHARHLYTLLIDKERCGVSRDEFIAKMHEFGIGTGVHYTSVHLQPYYRINYSYAADDFPNAKWISDRTVSIPLSAKLTDNQVERIVNTIKNIFHGPNA